MCGIVGYIGRRDAAPLLIQGLKKLEYRGYDSFGVATVGSDLSVWKKQGKISDAEGNAVRSTGTSASGTPAGRRMGRRTISTPIRTATATAASRSCTTGSSRTTANSNENWQPGGHTFVSETDTEVIAHLLEEEYSGDLLAAVSKTTRRLHGSYAILAVAKGDERIVAARDKSPLVLGIGDGEIIAASDMTPLLEHTERIVFLEDGDIVALTSEKFEISNRGRQWSVPWRS